MSETKLFITSLPSSTTRESFQNLFSKFGPISKFNLIKDRFTKKCKGFAFLVYRNASSAQEAIQTTLELKGRKLVVQYQKEGKNLLKEKKELKARRLYVGNLPRGTNDKVLKEVFFQFGEIENAYVIKNPDNGKLNNYGYVTFVEEKIVSEVIEKKVKIFGVVVKCRRFGDNNDNKSKKVGKIKTEKFQYKDRCSKNNPFTKKKFPKKISRQKKNIPNKKLVSKEVLEKMKNNPIIFSKDHPLQANKIVEDTSWFTFRNHLSPNIRMNLKQDEEEQRLTL